MNLRVLVATVAGGATLFLLGFLVYGVLLANYMKASMVQYPGLMKEPMPDFVPLVLANLAITGLFAFVFDHWAHIRTFTSGLVGGAMMMFLIALYLDLSGLSFMNLMIGITPLIVDVIAITAIGAITGGVVGLVLGLMARKTAEAV